jgi:hypothetical protein
VWITAANALALGLYSIGGGLGRMLGDRIQGERKRAKRWMIAATCASTNAAHNPHAGLLLAWLRAAEFSCDRAALLVTQVRKWVYGRKKSDFLSIDCVPEQPHGIILHLIHQPA